MKFKQTFMGDHIFGHDHFSSFPGHGISRHRASPSQAGDSCRIHSPVDRREFRGSAYYQFQSLLAGVSEDHRNQRIMKIREALLQLSVENLHPTLFAM